MVSTGEAWRRKRNELWSRSRGLCHYCEQFTPEAERTSDHIVPRAFGGPDAIWNLVPCCEPCNGGHGDSVRKHQCRICDRAIARFHRMKREPGRSEVVVWRRKHQSDDWYVADLLKRIERVNAALDAQADPDTQHCIALRGKLAGLREALTVCAVNAVVEATVTSDDPAA